jgi:signal transduction histidine kinase
VFHGVYLSGLFPVDLDISPYGLTLVGLTLAWGFFNYEFLDLMPVALRTVFASMSDAVIVLDTGDRVVDLNVPARQLVDPAIGDYLGVAAALVFPDWFTTALTSDDRQKRAELMINLHGEPRFFDMQLTSLHSDSGHYEGRLIVLRDITGRKQADDERERLLAELDAFSHTVAHDLKTPLVVLMGYSSLLVDEGFDKLPLEEYQQSVRLIAQTSQKMVNIVDELLLLASVRKEDGIEVVPLNMGAIVADAQSRLDQMITESGATIAVPESWPGANGHAAWVEEIWVNYLSNAIKYGGKPPRIELGADEQPDGKVRFWIRDNGRGLSLGEQAQLFSEFGRFRLTRVEGHGLGLSIVRRIVEKLGGQVGVESEIGQGSVFSFTLPSVSK